MKIRICYDNYQDFKATLWALEQANFEVVFISKQYSSTNNQGKSTASNYVTVNLPKNCPDFGSLNKDYLKCKGVVK